jgi:pyrrolidone-carboxylate peptidase
MAAHGCSTEHCTLWCLVTGFGQFSKLKQAQNPSEAAVQMLPDIVSVQILDEKVDVVIVKRTLRVAYATADELYQAFPDSVGHTKLPELILHVGVDCDASCVLLEERAVNQAQGVDVDGKESAMGRVTKETADSRVGTGLDLPKVAQAVRLRCQNSVQDPRIDVSRDAGRYLCNYIYYKACKWSASARTTKTQDGDSGLSDRHCSCSSGPTCLFVHVPMPGQPHSIPELTCILNEVIIACLVQRWQASPYKVDG